MKHLSTFILALIFLTGCGKYQVVHQEFVEVYEGGTENRYIVKNLKYRRKMKQG